MGYKEWNSITVEEICNYKTGKLNSNAAKLDGEYPFFTCSPETLKIDKYSFDQEAVLLAGNNANGIFPLKIYNGKFNAYQRTYVMSTNDKEVIDNIYLYYYLSHRLNYLKELSIGSATKFLTRKMLDKLVIYYPEYTTMKNIGLILSSIDNKINTNKNIVSNLEQLAQTLFKRWFVDFEFPNENGDPYKSSGGEMVESELGMIPASWQVYKLTELVNSISESINKKEKESAIFLNTSDILSGNILKRAFSSTKEMPGQAKKLIKENDILYSEIRPKNKRFAYINFNAEDYVVSTKLMVLRTNEEIFSGKVLYLFLTNNETVNELQLVAEQRSGTFPQITFKQLDHFKFALPSKSIFMKYYQQLEKMIDMQFDLNIQNESLIELRDTLLPKLLSGEIELPNETEVNEDVPIS